MKHRKMKGSDKETTITAEEYAQILKNAAETAQVAEQTGSKYSIDKAAYYAQLSKDAAAKVHESSEMEAKIETSSPCFEGPAQKFFINKTDLKAPLLGGDDIAYGDAIQPDFQHKEAKIDTGSNLIDMGSNFFEGKGDYIVYGSHTGQSNNTLTQYSSEQDADITSKLGTNNNLSQYLYNPKSDIPMLDIAPSEKVGITGVTPESDVASKVIYDYTPEQPIFEGTYIPQPFCEILDSSDFVVM
ncbi:hypothetical protein [uncultured Gammaproteobacteria bacterium]|nr:hypothetical protein [uncultured Gammaproteobacteria bacterium]